jgi:energy-coupling factor transport system substrate-specific component
MPNVIIESVVERGMSELVDTWRSPRAISFVAVTTVTYLVLSLAFSGSIAAFDPGSSPRIATGGVLVLGLLFGPAAAWGSALGYLGVEVVYGVLGFPSVFGAIGHFLLAYLGYNLWGNFGLLSDGSGPTMRSRRQIAEYFAVAFVSSSALIAITAWGYAVLGILPYFVTATASFVQYFLPTVVVGPVVLYFLYPRLEDRNLLYRDVSESNASTWRTYVTSLVLVSWLLAGNLASIGYQIYRRAPYRSFVRRDLESVRALAETIFGSAVGRIQVALGSVLFSALLLALIYHGGFGCVNRTTGEQ